jgi:pseudaminic acid cytidylyltransferase
LKKVAVITARGGSKRIPRKNIKLFLGKPIIQYSIDAALQSKLFDEVMVSTDDLEIKECAEQAGALVPFVRGKENSDDFATTGDVLKEVFSQYSIINRRFDFACCIYPTAPFVTPESLVEGFKVLTEGNFDSVVPVVKFGFPIQRAFKIESQRLQFMWPENSNVRSQDLIPTYHDAGQFYWLRVNSFLKSNKIIAENCGAIEISEMESQDIDNLIDWEMAELKYKLLHGSTR